MSFPFSLIFRIPFIAIFFTQPFERTISSEDKLFLNNKPCWGYL